MKNTRGGILHLAVHAPAPPGCVVGGFAGAINFKALSF